MATIVDVAQLAGVSVATVSRVIRNSNKVSEDKQEKVLDAIKALGYETDPNSTSKLRKKTLYLICGGNQDEFVDNIMEIADESGYDIAVNYTGGRALSMTPFLKKLLKNKIISGVLTCGLSTESEKTLIEIDKTVPVIQCCDEVMSENSFVVSSDDVMMGRDAVLHLAEKGCRRIAFIGLGKMKAPFKYSGAREVGYRMAHGELGRAVDERLIRQCDVSGDSVQAVLDELMSLQERPDGIFCARDSIAALVVNRLTRCGIKIPGEVLVMGCGSEESAQQAWLPLSNVTQSYYEIGREAISLMTARISGKTTVGRRLNIKHVVIDRETT
ncbi:MAG: LacI family DNA-binding transcriptional regulator [Clostridiales bacterium]|nr:LacI family DNA-binding transcriptional regulator [Clostridiales bacterium]